MSTPKQSDPLAAALQRLPIAFRSKLVESYRQLKTAQIENRYDTAGLKAGKFCEVCIRLLQHAVHGQHTAFGKQIPNFADECRKLVAASAPAVDESIRVIVPRALLLIYTMRNKRGLGHVGGDIDANAIDTSAMVRVADWVVCELIRTYHSIALEDAQDLIDAISVRQIPVIWEVNGRKRVLAKGLTAKKQTLLLLYSEPSSVVLAEDLCDWVEYASLPLFRRDVLRPLHKDRYVEFDSELDSVHLSPAGAHEVEANVLRNTSVPR